MILGAKNEKIARVEAVTPRPVADFMIRFDFVVLTFIWLLLYFMTAEFSSGAVFGKMLLPTFNKNGTARGTRLTSAMKWPLTTRKPPVLGLSPGAAT